MLTKTSLNKTLVAGTLPQCKWISSILRLHHWWQMYCYSSLTKMIKKIKFELLPHMSYILHLVPCNSHHFGPLIKMLYRHRFSKYTFCISGFSQKQSSQMASRHHWTNKTKCGEKEIMSKNNAICLSACFF
jgi:hypothetical protein